MRKNGYTMIELVSVVAILSIFAVIMIPRISNSIKASRADQLEDVRADVINASEVYLNSDCGKSRYDELLEKKSIRIYLDSVSDCGLIDNKIYNPMNGEYFEIDNEYINVSIDEVGSIKYETSF